MTTSQLLSLRKSIDEQLYQRTKYSLRLKIIEYVTDGNNRNPLESKQSFGQFSSIDQIFNSEIFTSALKILTIQSEESWLVINDDSNINGTEFCVASKYANCPAYYDGWYINQRGIKPENGELSLKVEV